MTNLPVGLCDGHAVAATLAAREQLSRAAGLEFVLPYPAMRALTIIVALAPLTTLAQPADADDPFRWLEDVDDYPCPLEQGLDDLRVVDAMLRAARGSGSETIVWPSP